MIKDNLTNLLKAGRNAEALERLIMITAANDQQAHDELIALLSRLNANSNRYNQNIISYEDFKQEANHINVVTLNYISQLASTDYFQNFPLESFDKKNQPVAEETTKILFIASNPHGTSPFQLEKEYLSIRRIFNNKRQEFEAVESFNTTLDGLFTVIRKERPTILHIAAPSTNEFLCLHRPDDTALNVPYDLLASAFIMFQSYVKCVFINTWCCPIFLKKISVSLQCAIGGGDVIDDNMCILFSNGFYTAIAQGKTYEEAYLIGSDTIKNLPKLGKAKNPFKFFKNGICNDPLDTTPEDFDLKSGEEKVNKPDKKTK